MRVASTALYSAIVNDTQEWLDVNQELAARLGGEVMVYPDSCPTQFAIAALLNNLRKKEVTAVAKDADALALKLFRRMNYRCKKFTLDTPTELDALLVGGFRQEMYRFFDTVCDLPDDLSFYAPLGRCGPGVTAGTSSTDVYRKMYMGPLEATSPSLVEAFMTQAARKPRWQSAEFVRQLHFGLPVTGLPSKLAFVPKSNSISRTICAEPTLNMWFQQAIGDRITDAINRKWGISLSTQQSVNRRLCYVGSRNGRLATIDLKSASDSVSLTLLRQCLPKNVMSLLELTRSKDVVYPDGTREELHMVSSMGNAYTFPLQTALFLCAVSSVYSSHDIKMRQTHYHINRTENQFGNFGVFGDDIVVEVTVYKRLCRLLTLLGFIVNERKSFSDGWFRESCGEDYFRGLWVRPVFCKSLETIQSRLSLFNALSWWSATVGVPLTRGMRLLLSWIPPRSRHYVPRTEDPSSGIQVPFAVLAQKGLVRQDENGSFRYRCYVAKPFVAELRSDGTGVQYPRTLAGFNPDGLFLAGVQGRITNNTFSIRFGEARYCLTDRVVLSWDFRPVGPTWNTWSVHCRWDSDMLRFLAES